MRIVSGKTGSNLIEMLMEVPHCSRILCFFVPIHEFKPKVLQEPRFMGEGSEGSGLQSTII